MKTRKASPVKVVVYFVVRGQKCELATSSKIQATSFVESFNKIRPLNAPAAVMSSRTIDV